MRLGVAVGGALGSGEGVGELTATLGWDMFSAAGAGAQAQAQSASAPSNAEVTIVIRRIR